MTDQATENATQEPPKETAQAAPTEKDLSALFEEARAELTPPETKEPPEKTDQTVAKQPDKEPETLPPDEKEIQAERFKGNAKLYQKAISKLEFLPEFLRLPEEQQLQVADRIRQSLLPQNPEPRQVQEQPKQPDGWDKANKDENLDHFGKDPAKWLQDHMREFYPHMRQAMKQDLMQEIKRELQLEIKPVQADLQERRAKAMLTEAETYAKARGIDFNSAKPEIAEMLNAPENAGLLSKPNPYIALFNEWAMAKQPWLEKIKQTAEKKAVQQRTPPPSPAGKSQVKLETLDDCIRAAKEEIGVKD